MALAFVVFAIFSLGVWASGSRTALLAALIGVGFLSAGMWRRMRPRQFVGLAAAGAALAAAIVLSVPSSTTGPFRRIAQFVPGAFTKPDCVLGAAIVVS